MNSPDQYDSVIDVLMDEGQDWKALCIDMAKRCPEALLVSANKVHEAEVRDQLTQQEVHKLLQM